MDTSLIGTTTGTIEDDDKTYTATVWRSMQGLIGRTSNSSNQAKVLVLFARTEATYAEEFVGIALTKEQESAMAEHVDSPSITCWTEEVPLQGWEGKLNKSRFPKLVYLVFREGYAQHSSVRYQEMSPEILAAFTTREAAQTDVVSRQKKEPSFLPSKSHIWEVEFGFLTEKFRGQGPEIPMY
ncbi:hypothetical protein ACWWUW_10930 [Corynebacterium striatum]